MIKNRIRSILAVTVAVLAGTSSAWATHNPNLGRFMQRDPLGYPDGMNGYECLASSPTDLVDPSGEVIVIASGLLQAPSNGERLGQILSKQVYRLVGKYDKGYRGGNQDDNTKFVPLGWGTSKLRDSIKAEYDKFVQRKKRSKRNGICRSLEQFVVIGHSDGATSIYDLLRSGASFRVDNHTPACLGMVDLVRLQFNLTTLNKERGDQAMVREMRKRTQPGEVDEIVDILRGRSLPRGLSPKGNTPKGTAVVSAPKMTLVHNHLQPNWGGLAMLPTILGSDIKGRWVFGAHRNRVHENENHLSIWHSHRVLSELINAASVAYERRVMYQMRHEGLVGWDRTRKEKW